MASIKELEIKMRQENEYSDILSKATGEVIWDSEIGSEKAYIAGNGYQFLFGYPISNEFIDIEFWKSHLHPEEKEKMINKIIAVINDENTERCVLEYRFLKANSSYAWVRDRFLILRENGKAVRMIGAMQDITKEKEEIQYLKLLESAMCNAIDPVLILESLKSDSDETKIIYVNDAFIAMSGYAKDEIMGKAPTLFRGPETSGVQMEELRKALRQKTACQVEIIKYNKKGNAYWVEVAIAPAESDQGNTGHFVAIVKDITKRKVQEQEQEKLIHELTQNNIDLRQFSYITSHNLRGPIASLLGLCTLLEHFKIEDPTLKQILDGVKKATDMFDGTIKDLTTVLNVRDRTSIPKQDILFSDVYEKALAQSEVLLEYCGAEVRANFENAQSVHYNKAYLESIFSNLITNAIKYRSQERRLKILITTELFENHIMMRVADNGLGIDLDLHKDKMFRLYQRFHDHAEGKGLGLFLIKSQLEALNGSIDIESTVGEGTTFILKFKR